MSVIQGCHAVGLQDLGTERSMRSPDSQHQILDAIETQLRSEDAQLTVSFIASTSITSNTDMPSAEQLNVRRLVASRRRRPRTHRPAYALTLQLVLLFLAGMVNRWDGRRGGIHGNTTDLRCSGSHEAVTWVFFGAAGRFPGCLLARRTPGRRWVSNPRSSRSPSCILACLLSLMQPGPLCPRTGGRLRGRWCCGPLACGFAVAGRSRRGVRCRRRASWRCSAGRW